jgi:magnesium-transporting ATPase (P-type)
MSEPPRPRTEQVIRSSMLVRAWVILGSLSAAIALGGFFLVLRDAGWSPGDVVREGSALHHSYLQATTMTFLCIVACQLGTAFAARTDRASLRTIGIFTNPLLLVGLGFEIVFALSVTYLPPLQALFETAAPPARAMVLLLPVPFVIWGVDEVRRALRRRSSKENLAKA